LVILTQLPFSFKIELHADDARSFSKLSAVSVDGKSGFINSDGQYVVPPQFGSVGIRDAFNRARRAALALHLMSSLHKSGLRKRNNQLARLKKRGVEPFFP
jgi:hypothetical protein